MVKTTDNNRGAAAIADQYIPDVAKIANQNVADLVSQNPDILIFPPDRSYYADGIEDCKICELNGNQMTTFNILGFLGVNNTNINITSRFDGNKTDYFLHYMLQKVFCLNIFDLKIETDTESIWDHFLIYLFPYYLNKAVNQGIYKEYKNRSYNNSSLNGRLHINRHIHLNKPFIGNIAYNKREHSYDNDITQLARHTIEFIKQQSLGNSAINNDLATRSSINQITFVTESYSRKDRVSIIEKNKKPITQPFYTAYEPLRKLCLQILRNEGLTFGNTDDKVYGLIFDGAWLWEEYLNTLLAKMGFIHPENKKSNNPIYLFKEPPRTPRYPDFYRLGNTLILDAKYKHIYREGGGDLDRNDIHQLITYMHVMKSNSGGFIYPAKETDRQLIGILNGFNGQVFSYSLKVTNEAENFKSYSTIMQNSENELLFLINETL